MKIVIWTESFWPYIGGVETFTAKLLPDLKKKGCDITVITGHQSFDLPDEETYEGIKLHRFKFREAVENKDFEQIMQIKKKVERVLSTADIVNIHMFGPGAWFYVNSKSNSKLIITMHEGFETMKIGRVGDKCFDSCDWVTNCSNAVRKSVIQRFPQVEDRCTVIYNGMEPFELEASALNFDSPTVLCVGRQVHDKGFDVALRAWSKVSKQCPNAKLILAGDGHDHQSLKTLSKELGIEGSVQFPGWISPEEIVPLIDKATIVVIPSRWEEPFCLVALEAALMKRPVVASSVGGLKEVVVDQQTGILVENENLAQFADAILSLISNSDQANMFGQKAYQRAIEKFKWETCVNSYFKIFQQVITESKNDIV